MIGERFNAEKTERMMQHRRELEDAGIADEHLVSLLSQTMIKQI